jgi:hypothetical protein
VGTPGLDLRSDYTKTGADVNCGLGYVTSIW